MTDAEIASLAKGFGAAIREALAARDKVIEELVGRVSILERDFENRKGLEYFGTWSADVRYRKNAAVTHDGSTWILKDAESLGAAPPGNGWQLAVKKGRDGRDRR